MQLRSRLITEYGHTSRDHLAHAVSLADGENVTSLTLEVLGHDGWIQILRFPFLLDGEFYVRWAADPDGQRLPAWDTLPVSERRTSKPGSIITDVNEILTRIATLIDDADWKIRDASTFVSPDTGQPLTRVQSSAILLLMVSKLLAMVRDFTHGGVRRATVQEAQPYAIDSQEWGKMI